MKYIEGIFVTSDSMCSVGSLKKEDKILLSNGTIAELLFISAIAGDNDNIEDVKKRPLADLRFTIFLEILKGDSHLFGNFITDIPGDTLVSCWVNVDNLEIGC